MFSTLCPDRESTQALGARLAPTLRAGDVILLSGDMGAGKSEFARGVARGLGIACAVPSPSFTILNVYEEGRVPLYHFDWYRIGAQAIIKTSPVSYCWAITGTSPSALNRTDRSNSSDVIFCIFFRLK